MSTIFVCSKVVRRHEVGRLGGWAAFLHSSSGEWWLDIFVVGDFVKSAAGQLLSVFYRFFLVWCPRFEALIY